MADLKGSTELAEQGPNFESENLSVQRIQDLLAVAAEAFNRVTLELLSYIQSRHEHVQDLLVVCTFFVLYVG